MQIDPFFQVPQRSVNTSMGAVEVPVLYKEGDYSIALFCTLRERVEALLAGVDVAVLGDAYANNLKVGTG